MIKNYFQLGVIALVLFTSCDQQKTQKTMAIDKANLDTSVSPGTDFDTYANGGWKKVNPIPDDKSRFGSFDKLIDKSQIQEQELIKKITSTEHTQGSIEQKIADFYNSGMDMEARNKAGLTSLKPYLDKIETLNSKDQINNLVAYFQNIGIAPVFNIYSSADAKNSTTEITYMSQGGLGMPDRDYYTNDDPRSVEIRAAYVEHLKKMWALMGEEQAAATAKADVIMKMETAMAEASMTRLERRDPHKTYNKYATADLKELTPSIDWNSFFTALQLEDPKNVIVSQPEFFKAYDQILKNHSVADWKVYFKWNLVNSLAGKLSQEYVDQVFDFYGKTMSGSKEMRPLWKRVLSTTSSGLSEAIGQIYVKEYFPPEAKERMVKLVGNLKLALNDRIGNLEWMGDATKAEAKEKLAKMRVKVGYPDEWKDYSSLEIKNDAFVLNVIRANAFETRLNFNKINKPVDKNEWHMPPQMVNAYYHPLNNEIVFPAAILQPPFFYLDADDAVNYGAIGVVIGHEMTHGFDDKGRLFDKNGNMNDWWTAEDAERFTKRADVLVKQFNEFVVLDTIHANGKLSLGENIADLGGLNISHTAFMKTNPDMNKKIDGFTPIQRFYLAYSHVWAQNIRDKEILRRTKEDVHSLGRFRVIGPLRNVAEFHKAFDIKEGDYMFLPQAERASIW
ncbi:M13 family peptidase [Puteibacter caeruleilacunae]|nr:M13 family peptidase [Puteibacter caeruleilacunae]